MYIYVSLKSIGKKDSKIKKYPFYLNVQPHNVRDLISEAVKTCVNIYNKKINYDLSCDKIMTPETIESMTEVGKMWFGELYSKNEAELDKSIENALTAFSDGVIKIFKEEFELKELNEPLEVNEGDTFAFIRLTMLTGRLW